MAESTASGYDTLLNGVGDRRLRCALAIVTRAEDVARECRGTLLLLAERAVTIELVIVCGEEVDVAPLAADLGLARVSALGHRPLQLPAEAVLRATFVAHIRERRPDVVIAPDPTPMLRMHPDRRLVARAALDAAWPYAGAALDPEFGPLHQPPEAWLSGGPEPDLFVRVDDEREETFAQVDFRDR